MLKIKEFDLSHWLANRRADYYTRMADKAVRRYRKKISPIRQSHSA